jgi:hypothetical protein
MFIVGNIRKNPPRPRRLASLGAEKRRLGNVTYWQAHGFSQQPSKASCNSKGILFLNERSWNVLENKGPLWKTCRRSWNVYENKCT